MEQLKKAEKLTPLQEELLKTQFSDKFKTGAFTSNGNLEVAKVPLKAKPTQAEALRERTDKSQYNRALRGMRKEADNGKSRYVSLSLTPLTIGYLEAEGFTVTIEPYFEFTRFVITW